MANSGIIELMQLYIFKFKLLLYLLGFFLGLVLDQVKKVKPILLVVVIFLLLFTLVFLNYAKSKIVEEEVVEKPSYSPSRPDLYIKSEKTQAKIQEEIVFWQKVLEKQPNSRDALINLSTLKRSINENEEADILWNQAKKIDPNNPVFAN